jgi:hypothetical protein
MCSSAVTKYAVVVSKYNEDISWTDRFTPHLILYDKSQNPVTQAIRLPNHGREADTYLKYILTNYTKLPEIVVFCQGKIDDHVSSMESFYSILKEIELPTYKAKGFVGLNVSRGNRGWSCIRNFRDPTHPGIPLERAWRELFASDPSGGEIRCNYCAIFMVHRNNILYRSREFYEKMKQLLDEDESMMYVYERLWATVFDGCTQSSI